MGRSDNVFDQLLSYVRCTCMQKRFRHHQVYCFVVRYCTLLCINRRHIRPRDRCIECFEDYNAADIVTSHTDAFIARRAFEIIDLRSRHVCPIDPTSKIIGLML